MRFSTQNWARSLRRLLTGPVALALLPVGALAHYFLGSEVALFVIAVVLTVGLVLASSSGKPVPGARDGLTGLSLRRDMDGVLDAALSEEPETGKTTACLILEIDDFNLVSERFGRKAAEDTLRQCANRIRGVLREDDTAARLDGACFGIALAPVRRADLETLIQISSRLQSALSEPIAIDGTTIYVSSCVGFCLASRAPARSGEALIEAAETALAAARQIGPGAIRAFSREMRVEAQARHALLEEIGAALENGEIRPWFQPQVSTDTGAVTGFEALARWCHPDRGVIAPADFLHAIESSGLAERLGEIILYKALTALRSWDKAGLDVPNVSVNFSTDELRNPKLVDKIRWELDRFDLAPERLVLEILETVVADPDDDTISRNINGLAALGCGIDLDDFGTGHASISNIRRFAVGRIKIDRSFVTHIDEDQDQQRMISAILTMAERLGLETLAEGVETIGEHAMLAQLGCNHVQGFVLARAMPVEDTPAWLQKYRAKLSGAPEIGRQTG